jgi:hypothetical protein
MMGGRNRPTNERERHVSEQRQFEEMVNALVSPRGQVTLPYVFGHGGGQGGLCAQVWRGGRKVGPVLVPNREGGQGLGDLLKVLGDAVDDRARTVPAP